MRLLLAILTAAVAAVLGLGVLVTANLHVFVAAHRDELRARGERALERPIVIGAVTPSWWPLGIRLAEVAIGEDPRFGAGPFLDAEAVRIRVRAWPLALGRVEMVGFVLDRPRITLVRDADGRWNVASLGTSDADRAHGNRTRGGRRHGPRVPLEWVVGVALSEIRDGRIDVEDRAGAVPRRLTAARLHLRAENVRLGAAAHLRAEAALFPGSTRPDTHVDLRLLNLGVNDAEHTPFSAVIELRDLDLATVAALAGTPDGAAGRVSVVTADVAGTLERFAGALKVGTEGAPLRFGRRLALPAVPATLAARIVREGKRVTLADGSGTIGALALSATGSADLDPWRAELSVRSRGGALPLVFAEPPVQLSDLALTLAFERGVAHIAPARLRLDEASVEIVADVTSLDPPALAGRFQASAFGGSLEGTVAPSGADRLALRVQARGIDAGALVARLTPAGRGRLSGRAGGDALFSVPVRGDALGGLAGTGTLTLTDATLRDVNVAEHVLGHVREVGLVPRLLSARTRARYPEIFDARHTVMRAATAPFTVGARRVATKRLVVTTEPYEVIGSGWIDFDGRVRFQGDLVLSSALSATLRADVPAAKHLAGTSGHVSVPFRLRGPLGVARPEPDLKRLRGRGLKLLEEARATRRDEHAATARRERPDGAPEEDPAAPVIERLERMLRP